MKPFKKGMMAFKDGELGNPYTMGTQRHKDWELGFNKAYFRNLERVKQREQASKNKA